MHVLLDSTDNMTFAFDSAYDNNFRERPPGPDARAEGAEDMNFGDLGRFISAMERSGADVDRLKVERMLKIVIPITSVIILLFAASLATSTQRGGAAYGVGLALGTTVIFIFLVQLTKGLGSNGLIPPEFAAWTPSIVFRCSALSCSPECARIPPAQQNVLTHRRTRVFPARHRARHEGTGDVRIGDDSPDAQHRSRLSSAHCDRCRFHRSRDRVSDRYQLFGGVQLSVVGLISRQAVDHSRARSPAHGTRSHGKSGRADHRGNRNDEGHRANRCTRDTRLRPCRLSRSSAPPSCADHGSHLTILANAIGVGTPFLTAVVATDVTSAASPRD